MRCREFPDRLLAEAARGEDEVLVAVRQSDGAVTWGVIPAFVEIDQGEGRDPVRQPSGEFLAHWWSEIEAARERECTEV